jgi:hypothetical protein
MSMPLGNEKDRTENLKIFTQGFTRRCRLSLFTNSALVYDPKCWGGVKGSCRASAKKYSCTQKPK